MLSDMHARFVEMHHDEHNHVSSFQLGDRCGRRVSGYRSFARLRTHAGAAGRNLPAIALTARARPEDRKATLEAGFNAHLAKPVDPMMLIRCADLSAASL
jgi:CheY-like chemotaxis protein